MLATPFRSAKELAADIRRKKIGCLELLDLYLSRVDKHNPALNAIIVTDIEGARKRARAADRALARKQVWGPLHGVPMTIKECFNVVGMPSTWGIPALKDNFPPRNALFVDRLLAAGVVLFGKTNVPIFLADYQSYNSIYGTTNNPWDLSRSPGGSSGGSAAALASGLTGIETGSDIGSSIRNPAHYCGVYGHKPTFGIVPERGHTLGRVAGADINVVGPMGRSAEDLEIGLSVMAGPDEIEAAGYKLTLRAPRQKALRDFKVAVMLTDPNSEVDSEVQEKVQAVAEFLAKKRAKVSDTARPDIDTGTAQRTYIHLLRAATSGRQTQEEFEKNVQTLRGLSASDETYYARMLRGGTTSEHPRVVGLVACAQAAQGLDVLLELLLRLAARRRRAQEVDVRALGRTRVDVGPRRVADLRPFLREELGDRLHLLLHFRVDLGIGIGQHHRDLEIAQRLLPGRPQRELVAGGLDLVRARHDRQPDLEVLRAPPHRPDDVDVGPGDTLQRVAALRDDPERRLVAVDAAVVRGVPDGRADVAAGLDTREPRS